MSKPYTKKMNCWEYMNCGRQFTESRPGTVCPARKEKGLHDVHGGMNGGRACWVVPETLCNGLIQGPFSVKFKECRRCTFYIKVRMEEGINFTMPTALLNMRDTKTVDHVADSYEEAETRDVRRQSETTEVK